MSHDSMNLTEEVYTRFPREIRDMIYGFLMPPLSDADTHDLESWPSKNAITAYHEWFTHDLLEDKPYLGHAAFLVSATVDPDFAAEAIHYLYSKYTHRVTTGLRSELNEGARETLVDYLRRDIFCHNITPSNIPMTKLHVGMVVELATLYPIKRDFWVLADPSQFQPAANFNLAITFEQNSPKIYNTEVEDVLALIDEARPIIARFGIANVSVEWHYDNRFELDVCRRLDWTREEWLAGPYPDEDEFAETI